MRERKHFMGMGRKPNRARSFVSVAAALLAVFTPLAPAFAQVTTVDPDAAIDSDLNQGGTYSTSTASSGNTAYGAQGNGTPVDAPPATTWDPQPGTVNTVPTSPTSPAPIGTTTGDTTSTYREDDLIGAAEGVFGKGAKGVADLIRDLLAKQGEPNAYIIGREAGAALAIGLRYGSGTLHHKVEGERPVYWTGPSIGFDAGANAGSAFVLVYNLYDTQELFHRFGAGEGQAYLVGGFTVSYLRRGNTVLIPVRAGAGVRLGANIGYMKFSEKQRWLPF